MAILRKETLGKDINGAVDYTLPKPSSCYDIILTPGVVKTTTVPGDEFNRAFFSYAVGTNVWVTFDGSDPATPLLDGESLQELNPSGRQVEPGDTLKFVSDAASHVNIRYDIGSK